MSIKQPVVVINEFVVGHSLQKVWGWSGLIALAFFLGKVGAGLFIVSLLLDFGLGMFIGLFIAVVGKGIAHLIYLGRPERFWRMFLHPRTSWVARGLWAMTIMAICGFFYSAIVTGWISTPGGLTQILMVLAVISTFVVMIYDGFIMSASTSIPLWNTALMPILCLFYSALGGVTLSSLLLLTTGTETRIVLSGMFEVSLIGINIIIVSTYVLAALNATSTAKQAVLLMIKGKYSAAFWLGVVIIGLIFSLILALIFYSTHNMMIIMALAVTDLIGHFLIFYLLLKVAMFRPVY